MAIMSGLFGDASDALTGRNDVESQIGSSQEEADRKKYLDSVKAQRALLSKQANDYRSNLGNYQSQLGDQAADSGRSQLAQQMSGITKSANSRGLLYSGLKQGAEAGAQSKYYSDLSKNRADINQQTEDQANQMDQRAMDAGFNQQQIEDSNARNAYQQALARRQSRDQAMGSVLGAAGGLVGAMA